jgi:HEAT repeat protein
VGSGAEHWERVEALTRMGAAGDRAAVPELVAVLEEDDKECWHTRTAAIRSLVQLGAVEAAPAILRTLARDDDPDTREAAVDALGAFGFARARRVLERLAAAADDPLAARARAALARLPR